MKEKLKLTLADGKSILLLVGDITEQQVDAIVNAANASLLGGSGVDGAIHAVGGPAITKECAKILAEHGPLPPGDAVATTAGNLKAGYVIHTVGPIYEDGEHAESRILARSHSTSLGVAERLRLVSVAFPAISTGAYGYPAEDAAPIALRSTIDALRQSTHVHDVRFVLFQRSMYDVYANAARDIAANDSQIRLDTLKDF